MSICNVDHELAAFQPYKNLFKTKIVVMAVAIVRSRTTKYFGSEFAEGVDNNRPIVRKICKTDVAQSKLEPRISHAHCDAPSQFRPSLRPTRPSPAGPRPRAAAQPPDRR